MKRDRIFAMQARREWCARYGRAPKMWAPKNVIWRMRMKERV